MNATRQIVSLGLIAGLLAGTASAHAGDVVMFEGPAPQAAQLARILWPNKHSTTGETGATRSIRISPAVGQSSPALHPAAVEVEAAEPVRPDRVQAPRPTSDVELAAAKPNDRAASGDAFAFQIRFAYDSTEILPESRSYLDSVGAMLRLPEVRGKKVVIVGHADASGSEQYNQVLSERRAATVRTYLTSRFGVAADRLEAQGEGETDPLAGTDPYAAKNRRVEFHAAS
jgi:outer membrane protein OmpA-like peptidoglycan-associated protein